MIVKVRKIGNSRGVILSKSMMEQCNIRETVNVIVKGDVIVIEPYVKHPRDGWEEQFQSSASSPDKDLIGGFKNDFDESEWTW